jgi:hypothetical protein
LGCVQNTGVLVGIFVAKMGRATLDLSRGNRAAGARLRLISAVDLIDSAQSKMKRRDFVPLTSAGLRFLASVWKKS